jgi:hypothetical protein
VFEKTGNQLDDKPYSGERSTYTKYLISSGTYGFFYGLAADYIFGIDGAAASGFPLVVAGASSIIPVFAIKNRKVSTNSLLLSLHGKSIGAFQGTMLGLLIGGNEVNKNLGKLTLGIATVSSIALGRLGYSFGRNKPWTDGRVTLYKHYGWLMPFEGMAIVAAIKSEDVRVYAATSLAFGTGGYFVADKVANNNDYSRGDVIGIQTLSLLNTGLGFGIMSEGDFKPAKLLIPAAGAIGGTIVSQLWLKSTRFTYQQGRNLALAASGGALIGEGVALILNTDSGTPYYLIPYVTGMISYSLLVERYRTKNQFVSSDSVKPVRWHFNFMPQNILINQKLIGNKIIEPDCQDIRFGMLPAFSATCVF